jgi:hypothetical protein
LSAIDWNVLSGQNFDLSVLVIFVLAAVDGKITNESIYSLDADIVIVDKSKFIVVDDKKTAAQPKSIDDCFIFSNQDAKK